MLGNFGSILEILTHSLNNLSQLLLITVDVQKIDNFSITAAAIKEMHTTWSRNKLKDILRKLDEEGWDMAQVEHKHQYRPVGPNACCCAVVTMQANTAPTL